MKTIALACIAGLSWCVSGAVLDTAAFAKKSTILLGGAKGDAAVADVPVAVRISPSLKGFTYDHCAANGADIRFADAAGNLIPHDIEIWDRAGESLIWVKVPSIPTTGTVVTMYYQAADVGALPAVSGADVWSNYRGVWHLDDTGSSIAEASGQVAAGTIPQPDVTKLGEAGVLGTSVLISNSDSEKDNKGGVKLPSVDHGDTFTASVWLKHRLADYYYDHVLYRKAARTDADGWGIEMDWDGSSFRVTGAKGEDADVVTLGRNGALDDWVHFAFVFKGTSFSLFRNGRKIGTGTVTPATDNGKNIVLGNDTDIGVSGADIAWHGWMDEFRLSKGGETDGALETEYLAMAPDSGFVSVGACVPVGEAPIVVALDDVAMAEAGQAIAVSGTVREFGTAKSLTLKLLWGATEKLEGAPIDLGTTTAFGPVSGRLPCAGLQEGATYYVAIQARGDNGEVVVTETRSLPYYTGFTWAGAAGDTWSSTAWRTAVASDPVAFTANQYAVLTGAAAQKTVAVDQPVSAAGVTVDADDDYVFAGAAKLTTPTLVKKGKGKLTISGAGLSDGTEITVKAGVLTLDATSPTIGATPFGVDSTITVENGAAFDINTYETYQTDAAKNNRTRSAIVKIAGAGPDGSGALVNGGTGWNAALSRVELTDDATIGGPGRIDVRPSVGVAMEGFIKGPGKTLTILDKNCLNIVGGDTVQLGKIVVKDGGAFSVENENITWDVPGGITLTGGGRIIYRYDDIPVPVTIPDGDAGTYMADASVGRQTGKTTVGPGATLTLNGTWASMLIGPLENNGTVLAMGNGPYLAGPTTGDGVYRSEGVNFRMAGGFQIDTMTCDFSGGVDLGCPDAPGYPQVANLVGLDGSPLNSKGDIYLRAGGNGTLGASWDHFFCSTAGKAQNVIDYHETANVTTFLDHVNWTVGQVQQANGSGQSHIRLVNGSKIVATNDWRMGVSTGPRSASLYLEPGTELRVEGSGNDAFAMGQSSGQANGVFQLTVDGAKFSLPDAFLRVCKDAPYGYATAMNGAEVRVKGIGSRASFASDDSYGARDYVNGDECFKMTGGSLVEVGAGALRASLARTDRPSYDFEDGTLRPTADWNHLYDWPQIAFGANPHSAGKVTFDLNGMTVNLKAAIGGASEVELKGSGTFKTSSDVQAMPVGKWTVGTGVTADLSGFNGFGGGLELAENASAKMNLNVQEAGDVGLVEFDMFPGNVYTKAKAYDGPLAMRVDNLALLHSARGENQKMQMAGFLWRGQFLVPEGEEGTWYFAGTWDDNIYFEIDGQQTVLSTTWNAVATGTRELTAGWHDFRIATCDGIGGQGPAAANGWNNAMGLGWTRFAPASGADKNASTYTKFDTSTLKMRPPTNTIVGVRWQRGAGAHDSSTWEVGYEDPVLGSYTNVFAAGDSITNSLRVLNSSSAAVMKSRDNRFLGYFKVDADKAGTWEFKGQYDDTIYLRVDGRKVIANTAWNALKTATVELDAGWHAFDIRVGDGVGGWGPSGMKDDDGCEAGLTAKAPGGRALCFDERNFRIVASIFDIANDAGAGLGGDILLNAGSVLENAATRGYCPIRGRLDGAGTGTLKGRFRMDGGTLVIPGPGSRLAFGTQFQNVDANFLAGLGAIELDLAGKPTFGQVSVCDAYGLTAEDAARIPVTAKIADADAEMVEKYADAFSATVKNGKLVVCNARGGGFVFYLR